MNVGVLIVPRLSCLTQNRAGFKACNTCLAIGNGSLFNCAAMTSAAKGA